MKAMHTLGAAILGTLLTGAAFAQTANTTPTNDQNATQSAKTDKKAERQAHMDKMAKELNLTADQQAQLKTIHQDAKQQAQAIKKDASLSADPKKAKMKELRADTKSKTDAILTPEQREKMAQMHANHKGKKGNHGQTQ
jgi:Spy/CpxP family protein refolding chaperone